MWLIDTATLELKSFSDTNQPYVILSHTWGTDEEEVTFQEMQAAPISRATRAKAGFQKIQKTCEIARDKYNSQYAWVDTCSIDKSSSAELSEAINSMFRWYRDSKICIAYLSDVDQDIESFKQSRWFTRGWTLQELLAPVRLRFFNKHWQAIGTKKSLAKYISETTGISTKLLYRKKELDEFPVAARMSWAASRQTKRIEDLAYCLMGIFDVNMPMIYGEGEKAFIRLQEEIIRQTADLSIFLWSNHSANSSSPFTGLLAHSPSQFGAMGGVSKMFDHLAPPEYYLTNLGIVIRTYFYWDQSGRLLLDLRHKFPDGKRACMPLQPIGIDSAVRVDVSYQIPGSIRISGEDTRKKKFVIPKTINSLRCYNLETCVMEVAFSGAAFTDIQSSPEYLSYPIKRGGGKVHLYSWRSQRFLGQFHLRRNSSEKLDVRCHCINGRWRCEMDTNMQDSELLSDPFELAFTDDICFPFIEKDTWDMNFQLQDGIDASKSCKISASFRSNLPRADGPKVCLTIHCTANDSDSDDALQLLSLTEGD